MECGCTAPAHRRRTSLAGCGGGGGRGRRSWGACSPAPSPDRGPAVATRATRGAREGRGRACRGRGSGWGGWRAGAGLLAAAPCLQAAEQHDRPAPAHRAGRLGPQHRQQGFWAAGRGCKAAWGADRDAAILPVGRARQMVAPDAGRGRRSAGAAAEAPGDCRPVFLSGQYPQLCCLFAAHSYSLLRQFDIWRLAGRAKPAAVEAMGRLVNHDGLCRQVFGNKMKRIRKTVRTMQQCGVREGKGSDAMRSQREHHWVFTGTESRRGC